mgnify:CR=1 FL=1
MYVCMTSSIQTSLSQHSTKQQSQLTANEQTVATPHAHAHTATHRITLHRTASHRIAPHRTASHRITLVATRTTVTVTLSPHNFDTTKTTTQPHSHDRHSSFVVRRSSFVVRRSSFVVRRSSFVVRHSSTTQRLNERHRIRSAVSD